MAEKQWDILTVPRLPITLYASDSSFGIQLAGKASQPWPACRTPSCSVPGLGEGLLWSLSWFVLNRDGVEPRNMQVSLRQQIESLSTSLAAFERAERELLLGSG